MKSSVLSQHLPQSAISSQRGLGLRILFFSAIFVLGGCKPPGESAQASCPLSRGDYPVQSVIFQAAHGIYDLIFLTAPACLHQPLKMKNLKLARFGDDEKPTEK